MYLLCFEIAIISLNNSLRGNKSILLIYCLVINKSYIDKLGWILVNTIRNVFQKMVNQPVK